MYKTSKAQGPIVNNLLEMYSPLCFSFKERTLRVEAVDIKQEKKGNDKENVKGGFCLLYCEVEMFVIGFRLSNLFMVFIMQSILVFCMVDQQTKCFHYQLLYSVVELLEEADTSNKILICWFVCFAFIAQIEG